MPLSRLERKMHNFKRDTVRVEWGEHSDLIVPLVVDDEVVGIFNFTSRASGSTILQKRHFR